jgi:hypothetical protein
MRVAAEKWLAAAAGLAFVSALAVPLTGCVTKSAAAAQARIAYLAGQRDAWRQMEKERAQGPSVTFIGQVKNHIVSWTPGLTLAQGIINAVYTAPTDPTTIIVHREGQTFQTSPDQLLGGRNLPLQPGDVVEIH